MPDEIRVVHYGLGPIGASIARLVAKKRGLSIVGAVDVAEEKVGKDLSEVIGVTEPLGVKVSKAARQVFAKTKADIVIHATSSYLNVIKPQLTEILNAGIDIVSTAEELSYPFYKYPQVARELDSLARKNDATLLGTGVNPGFAMDVLALTMTVATQEVRRISVERVVDASQRRLPLQIKIGAGITEQEFRKKIAEGNFGHIGLPESIAMIADGLGWDLTDVKEEISPVISKKLVRTEYLEVPVGRVAGIHQRGHGIVNGEERISMDLQMYVGAPDALDTVHVEGTPNIDLIVRGGLHGDLATVAIIVNMIPKVVAAEPGLKTMKDLPIPSAFTSAVKSVGR